MFQLLSALACVTLANPLVKGLMASGIFHIAETSACSCTAQLFQGMQDWYRSEKKLLQRRFSWASSICFAFHKYQHWLPEWKKYYDITVHFLVAKAWQNLLCSSHCSVLTNWGSMLNTSTRWITGMATVLLQTIRNDQEDLFEIGCRCSRSLWKRGRLHTITLPSLC